MTAAGHPLGSPLDRCQDDGTPGEVFAQAGAGESEEPVSCRLCQLILSWLRVAPKYRGNKTRPVILKPVLSTIGRSTAKVILETTPEPSTIGPLKGPPDYVAGKAELRRYWESFGFQPAHSDHPVFDDMSEATD